MLSKARQLLHDVLPAPARTEHEWAGSIVQLHAHAERVMHALELHAGTARAVRGTADIRVQVQERYLSVAGVVALLDDGAEHAGAKPLHTGRYVNVTLAEGGEVLATLWLPVVPVFRVSARLVA